MLVEVLMSCMHTQDMELIKKSNIQSNCLMINQGDIDDYAESFSDGHKYRMISTRERGLSKSRNMAIKHCEGDIGLVCDDDEVFDDDMVDKINDAYAKYDADIICFRFRNQPSRLKQVPQLLNKWTVLRISSWQISFKVEKIRENGLSFDEYMGAGSGNGAGEEVKFLRDCLKKGLKIYYVPVDIGVVNNDYYESGKSDSSQWFKGFDEKFFYQRGMVNRYMLGLPVSLFYALYYTIVKRNMYKKYISPWNSFKYTIKGIIDNDIVRQKKEGERK